MPGAGEVLRTGEPGFFREGLDMAADPGQVVDARLAKRVRRSVIRAGEKPALRSRAEERFGMPASALTYARDLGPIYVPARPASI